MTLKEFTYLLSIDGGLSSGVVMGAFSDNHPYEVIDGWQFGGGVKGMMEWLDEYMVSPYHDDWVCERFVPLTGKGFSLTVDSMEPVAIEGALMARGIIDRSDMKRMQRANAMYFVGGKTKPEKRKRLKQFLKDTNNYRFGKDLGAPDNEDFVSATAHGVSYVMKVLKHKATFELVRDWSTENGV